MLFIYCFFFHVSEKGVQFPNFLKWHKRREWERKLRLYDSIKKNMYANFKWVSNVINDSVNCSFFWFWISFAQFFFSRTFDSNFSVLRCLREWISSSVDSHTLSHTHVHKIYFYGLGTFYHVYFFHHYYYFIPLWDQ